MKAVNKSGQDFVEASYKAAESSIVTGQWESLDAEAVAAGRPWRTFPWYLGQKNYGVCIGAPPKARTSDTSHGWNSRDSCWPTSIQRRERYSASPFNCVGSLGESGFAEYPTTWCARIVARLSLM